MQTATYSQVGNYAALAGLAVLLLGKIGVITDSNTLLSIGAAVVSLVGIVKQFIDHKNLKNAAVSAGASIR